MAEEDVDLKNFAVPSALDLESQRRPAIPGYRREVIHNTTTQNEYRPGTICYIPYDSGAAGAFCDPSTVRLEGTVEVRNRNYYCDAFNLPRCGWHCLIQEFGIEIGGVLHELNRHYGECVELDMIRRGENRTPFYMIRENEYSVGGSDVGKMHINFVKPSMITNMGLPHGVAYPPLTTATSDTYSDTIGAGYLLQAHPYMYESWGRDKASALSSTTVHQQFPVNGNTGQNTILYKANTNGFFSSSNLGATSFYDDSMATDNNKLAYYQYKGTSGEQYGEGAEDGDDMLGGPEEPTEEPIVPEGTHIPGGVDEMSGTTLGQDTLVFKQGGYYGLPHGGRLLHQYCRTIGFTNRKYMFALNPGESLTASSPGMWPAYQPCDLEKLQKSLKTDYSLISAHNVVDYYANCQNIPCAIPVQLNSDNGSSAIWGSADHSKPFLPDNGFSTFFTFSLKIYSSLIGELAKVWFPELLVPQQKMRIRIRFQEPNLVFQTVMDPCRRVPGTSRDWFPNLGVQSSGGAAISDVIEQDPKYILSGIHPIMVSNYAPGFCYVDAIAKGVFPVPQLKMKSLHTVRKLMEINDNDMPTIIANVHKGVNYLPRGFTSLSTVNYKKVLDDTITQAGTDLHAATDAAGKRIPFANMAALNNLWGKILYETEQNQEYGFPPNFNGVNLADKTITTAKPYYPTGDLTGGNTLPPSIVSLQQYVHPTNFRQYFADDTLPTEAGAVPVVATRYDTDAGNAFVIDPYFDWEYKALNWNPFCAPTPQYLPIENPSNKLSSRVLNTNNFVNENQLCFGTHYPRSKMQVRRTHSSLYPLSIPDSISSRIDERLTYVVRNVQLVTQQIVLPRAAGLSIISNSLAGGLVSEANAWTEIETTLPEASSQKVLVNAAMAFCTSITFVFQPNETIQGDQAYGYRFGSFLNPFTAFDFIPEDKSIVSEGSSFYNNLGGSAVSYYNEITTAERIPFDIQLQLSSELIPRTPMSRLSRFLTYNRWGDGVFTDIDYADIAPNLQPSYNTTNDMTVNTLQDGFWACHIPIRCLDDQTITSNPFFVGAEISLNKLLRGRRGRVQPLPITVPYVGSFHITFNLETFMGLRSRMRTGMPIVNNNLFLKMERAHMCRLFSTRMLALLEGDGKWIYERGGMVMFIK